MWQRRFPMTEELPAPSALAALRVAMVVMARSGPSAGAHPDPVQADRAPC